MTVKHTGTSGYQLCMNVKHEIIDKKINAPWNLVADVHLGGIYCRMLFCLLAPYIYLLLINWIWRTWLHPYITYVQSKCRCDNGICSMRYRSSNTEMIEQIRNNRSYFLPHDYIYKFDAYLIFWLTLFIAAQSAAVLLLQTSFKVIFVFKLELRFIRFSKAAFNSILPELCFINRFLKAGFC